ncbi:MAG TPA: GspH/FimT family pseudopilin [Actinomycetales bacterium]|nr:GspH/FimT family pseudopilin [Actinomycetales bacterium]
MLNGLMSGAEQRSDRVASRRGDDSGFTLVELMVTMTVASIMLAIGIFGFANWQRAAQQKGSARELVSTLRNASERAISEGRTYCVDINAAGTAMETWRYTCGVNPASPPAPASQLLQKTSTQSTKVTLTATVTNPSPAPTCPTSYRCVYFYPRGTATPATVVVASSVRTKTYTVTVEGLTARVYSPEL